MSLQESVRSIIGRAPATFGIAACHVSGEAVVLLNEHEVFPSASVIKVPMLVELMFQRDEGRISLDEVFTLRDAHRVAGSGVLKELHDGLQVTLRDLAVLMIILSDNTATNMVVDRIGMENVNERMRGLGLKSTVLARRMYDWERQRLGHENQITPHDMMSLLCSIAQGRISSKSTSEEIVDIMARQQYRDKIPLLLPEDTRVANKTGSITRVTHDAGIVYTPQGPFVLCAFARDVDDVRQTELAIAEVSLAVYNDVTGCRMPEKAGRDPARE